MNEHTCPGPDCQRVVPDTMLMCPAHWKQVPFDLRRNVLATYNFGAGMNTQEHTDAKRAAILSIAKPANTDLTWPCDFCKEERPDSCISVLEKEVSVPGRTSSSFPVCEVLPNGVMPPPMIAPVTTLPMRKRHCNDRPACITAAQEWIPRLEVFDPG